MLASVLTILGVYFGIGVIVAIIHWRFCFSTFTWSFKDQLVVTLVTIPVWPIFLFGGIYMRIKRSLKNKQKK